MRRVLKSAVVAVAVILGGSGCFLEPVKPPSAPGLCMFDNSVQTHFGDVTCRNNAGQLRDVGSFNWSVLTPTDESDYFTKRFYNRVQISVSTESGCELHLIAAEVRESPSDVAGCEKHSDYDLIPAGGSFSCTGQAPYASEYNWLESGWNGQSPLVARVIGQAICPAGHLD